MRRIRLIVAYDGTDYCGWQIQPNGMTIEEVLNEKLKKLREKVRFGFWEKYDELQTVVRFATSWSTTEDDLKWLKEIL